VTGPDHYLEAEQLLAHECGVDCYAGHRAPGRPAACVLAPGAAFACARLGTQPAPQQYGDPGVVKVRLSGDQADIDRLTALWPYAAEVIEARGPWPNRHEPGVRMYLTVRAAGDGG
jgi:hypothetical protein